MSDWIAARGWVRPSYDGHGFASLPGTVTQLLCGEAIAPPLAPEILDRLERRYERIVLVLFDGFGWQFATQHVAHPLLARARAEGVLTRLTSQFPSTTAAHLTTIHTGLPVAEHGIYEWNILEPSLNRLITPLRLTFAGDDQPPLPDGERFARRIYPPSTLYEWLGEREVASAMAISAGYIDGHVSRVLLRGVAADARVGFYEVGAGLAQLADRLSRARTPAYGFAYIDVLDALLHQVGPAHQEDTQVRAEIEHLLTCIHERLVAALPSGTLVLVTADHGHTPVSPRETVYVNRRWPQIAQLLRTGEDGHPLAPAGSCRDLFLHVRPERVQDALALLRPALAETAEVRSSTELVDAGLFGASPSERLRERLGDVVVLPELGGAAYWHTPARFRQKLWSQHGGLTPQETHIPLLALHA